MRISSAKDVSAVLRHLKAVLPIKRRLRVRVIRMQCHGSCDITDNERLITISLREQDPAAMQVDSLIHEYAHALEWDMLGVHSKLWGRLHAKVYTAWVSTLG